jgi:hypothetical protein
VTLGAEETGLFACRFILKTMSKELHPVFQRSNNFDSLPLRFILVASTINSRCHIKMGKNDGSFGCPILYQQWQNATAAYDIRTSVSFEFNKDRLRLYFHGGIRVQLLC